MKRVMSFLMLVCASSASASQFSLMNGVGFTAPNINGSTNVGNAQIGDIVFDTSAGGFYGYGGSTLGWLSLAAASGTYHAPTVQKLSGSGTYTPPSPTPLYIRIRMVGGGGGGAGGGSSSGGTTYSGGNTTFGGTLLVAGGGNAGVYNGQGVAGGTVSTSAGPTIVAAFSGGYSSGVSIGNSGTVSYVKAGDGGVSVFGGAGSGCFGGGTATAGISGTGSGGGGGCYNGTADQGSGGGAGGYIEALINSPTSYSYVVGSGGTGGTGGTGGSAGANGGSGSIIVEEFYQ